MFDVLLVEDDERIRQVICDYVGRKDEMDIKLHIAVDGSMGLDLIYENEYDLVLLDVMMPGADGFELCRELRKKSSVPIIFLTARGREEDVIYGYDIGCDDYIVKPFSLATLYVKMRALLNRSKGTIISKEMKAGEITLNPATMTVKSGDDTLELAQKQYLILKILMENKGVVVTREKLILRIWGYDYDGDERILDNHMKKLRKALGSNAKQIKTVIGKGYKITGD